MPPGLNGIATRQLGEALLSLEEPLGVAISFEGPVRDVSGYARVILSGISDQTFTYVVEEAATKNGPFVVVGSFSSTLVGSVERLREEIVPVGNFMRITVENDGAAENFVQANAFGIPY